MGEVKKKRGGAGRGQGRKRIEDKKRQVRVSVKGSRIDSLGGDQVLSYKLEGMVEDMYQNKVVAASKIKIKRFESGLYGRPGIIVPSILKEGYEKEK